MKNTMTSLFIFAVGAAVGSVVTWKLIKTKYEQIAQEEIDSVKEVFGRRHKDTADSEQPNDVSDESIQIESISNKPDIREYASQIMKTCQYTNYATVTDEAESDDVTKEESEDMGGPYVITPEEFSECEYDIVSLTYYADGILANDQDEIIEDVDDVVGKDSLNHFGEYEDDSVYVRDDALKIDYEILRDVRNYNDIHEV